MKQHIIPTLAFLLGTGGGMAGYHLLHTSTPTNHMDPAVLSSAPNCYKTADTYICHFRTDGEPARVSKMDQMERCYSILKEDVSDAFKRLW